MSRGEIVSRLRECAKHKSVNLPRDIDFTIAHGVLTVFVHRLAQNMQSNGAAFEAWILVLKSWLPCTFERVELDFAESAGADYGRHYNRFLYRVYNLLRLFPHWFSMHESKERVVSEFIRGLRAGACVLNQPLRMRVPVVGAGKYERQVESWFTFGKAKRALCCLWDLDPNRVFNQLPVGVFHEEVADANAVFPGGSAAIDLWGVGLGRTLHVIELKRGCNIGLGVISEVLFYTSVMYDTFSSYDPMFTMAARGASPDTADITALKNGGNRFKGLSSHIMAEQYHPLLDDGVVALVGEGLSRLGIAFDTATYHYPSPAVVRRGQGSVHVAGTCSARHMVVVRRARSATIRGSVRIRRAKAPLLLPAPQPRPRD